MTHERITSKQRLIMRRTIRSVSYVVNYISECSHLAQKDTKVVMIHMEFYNRLKFVYNDNWYMHKLESVRENKEKYVLVLGLGFISHLPSGVSSWCNG